ncbi:MAG: BLUF domain-containing protein [Janthinobacterium lividum]
MPLHHLIYESQARKLFTESELAELLRKARAHNEANGLTGMLLYAPDGRFIQVLEGSMTAIHKLYFESIVHDPRHYRLQLLTAGVLDRRRFGSWRMGYRLATCADLTDLSGHLDTADATFLLPLLHIPSPLLDKLLDYVQYTLPSPGLEEPSSQQ